jgi:hypothetical protein
MLGHSPQVITNGLLFYYDMGNPQKSWKGAPTINLLLQPLSPQTWAHERNSSFGFISDEFFTYNGSLGKNIPAYRRTLTGTDFRATRFDVPWTAHTQSNLSLPLTGSIYGRCLNPSSSTRVNINFQGTNSSGSRVDTNTSIEASSDWKLFSDTGTLSNNGFVSLVNFGMKYYMNGDSTPRTWEFMMPQVEQQPFATPFVNGTRSNTQAILDLVGNNTITANEGVTYLNNGMFELLPSNSNSTLTIPLSTSLNKPTGTISAWVYPKGYFLSNGIFVNRDNSTPNALDWLWIGSWGSGSIFYFRLGNGSDCCSQDLTFNNWTTVCPVNTWTNITVTWQSANFSRIYVNGALIASRTITSIPNTNPSSTGRIGLGHDSSGTGSWNGLISNFSIFNRALSATEVQQNFNALRGRYGL